MTVVLAGITGCQADGDGLPARSADQVRLDVQTTLGRLHADSAPVAAALAGHWQGSIALGGAKQTVSGVASASGLVLLVSDDAAQSPWLLRHLRSLDGGGIVGELVRMQAGAEVERIAIEGQFGSDGLDAVLLPPGWSLPDYLAGTRQPSASEAAQFGSLRLVRKAAQPPLATVQPGSINGLRADGQGALSVDPNGNVAGQLGGCELVGGVAPSSSVGGVLEVAVDVMGMSCIAKGPLTGFVYAVAVDTAQLTLSDGERSVSEKLRWPLR